MTSDPFQVFLVAVLVTVGEAQYLPWASPLYPRTGLQYHHQVEVGPSPHLSSSIQGESEFSVELQLAWFG